MAKASGGGVGRTFRNGTFVRNGMLRGFVRGTGTIGKDIAAYLVDIGGGRQTLFIQSQTRKG